MTVGRPGRHGIALLVALVTVALSGAALAAVFAWTAMALRSGRAWQDAARAAAQAESLAAAGVAAPAPLPGAALRLSDSVWLFPVTGQGATAALPLELLVRLVMVPGPDSAAPVPVGRPASRRWRFVPAF